MKTIITFIFSKPLVLFNFKGTSQTIWTGSIITFTKANNTVWILEANQYRITSNVWVTRQDNECLFNIVTESSRSKPVSLAVIE